MPITYNNLKQMRRGGKGGEGRGGGRREEIPCSSMSSFPLCT